MEAVVWLAQKFRSPLMPEYLMWVAVWRSEPRNGRGAIKQPQYGALDRGDGLFWDVLDVEEALVQCYVPQGVRLQLRAHYQDEYARA